jgi:PTH1 family peptidyl-tRNA hydrolase
MRNHDSELINNHTLEDQHNHRFLIVGLGNPGRRYKNNRHNIGFMTLNTLADRLGETFSCVDSNALVIKCSYKQRRLILAKPQTFMNDSGRSVNTLARYYKIPSENLLVTYDDVDLPFGTLRMRPFGGSGGHKGMKDIINRTGTEEFPRVRIGVDRPPRNLDAAAHVLRDFSKEELKILPDILDYASDSILTYIVDGIDKAMNQYNLSGIGANNNP